VKLPRAALPVADLPQAPAVPVPSAEAEWVPEGITIPELRELWAHGEAVTLVDVRTDRTYRSDQHRARGAVRVPPDDAVRSARQLGLAQHATLVVYCA
jgi:rhodanese-related sulfurtransferase